MAPSSVIVFDLDDTLYLERDFVRSGFRAAAMWLQQEIGLPGLETRCLELFADGHRTHVFDIALRELGAGDDGGLVARLVEVYRTHMPTISLAGDAERYLRQRPDNRRYALITDGPAATQMAKIRALDLERRLDHVICTGAWGSGFDKPHPRAFQALEAWSGTAAQHLVYVADNPSKDFVTPKARGWWTVQIRRAERIHQVTAADAQHEAHAAIVSLEALDDCLADLDWNWALPRPGLRAGA